MRHTFLAWLVCGAIAALAPAADVDRDGDGLSDFHETHKYGTNPASADSDGDGTADGDWHERREYAYTIRIVAKVMRPCDPAVATDDYQDARVLAETKDYVELEVIHYPLNTIASAIVGSRDWRSPAAELKTYLEPGVTTNWDEAMRRQLVEELAADGIVADELTDREVVERVSAWLLARGKYRYMFGTYFLHFPEGKAAIFPGLEQAFRREGGNTDLPFEEHLEHEVFGKGMFENKCYGTCTSTAIYLTTGLRAVGIPTRMILAIPPIDGSDEQQRRMLAEHLSHHAVRQTIQSGVPRAGFASHTFNEVYVGGRWRRLNYSRLGQNSYGQGAMGLLTHVLTFRDLSEAGLTETWGWRYGRGERDQVFPASNPYRTTELSDRFGIHSSLANPEPEEVKEVVVSKAYWFHSAERPANIAASSVKSNGDGHLLVHAEQSFGELKEVYPKLHKEFVLSADGEPPVRARAERGYWNSECYLRIPADAFAVMRPGKRYRLSPARLDAEYRWRVAADVTIEKPQ